MAIDWGSTDPNKLFSGMLSTGADLWGASAQRSADEKRLAAARGPVYQQAQQGALGEMAAAGNVTPDSIYAQNQALVAPTQAKQTADMQRQLYAKGLLGVANYNPGVEGIQAGTKMNPHMAAMFAGQNAANAKLAAGATDQASALRTAAVGRASTLQGVGANQQTSGLAPYQRGSGVSSAGKSMLPGMISGIGGLLKDSGALKGIGSWIAGLGNTAQTAGADMFNPYDYSSPSLRQDDFSAGYY